MYMCPPLGVPFLIIFLVARDRQEKTHVAWWGGLGLGPGERRRTTNNAKSRKPKMLQILSHLLVCAGQMSVSMPCIQKIQYRGYWTRQKGRLYLLFLYFLRPLFLFTVIFPLPLLLLLLLLEVSGNFNFPARGTNLTTNQSNLILVRTLIHISYMYLTLKYTYTHSRTYLTNRKTSCIARHIFFFALSDKGRPPKDQQPAATSTGSILSVSHSVTKHTQSRGLCQV